MAVDCTIAKPFFVWSLVLFLILGLPGCVLIAFIPTNASGTQSSLSTLRCLVEDMTTCNAYNQLQVSVRVAFPESRINVTYCSTYCAKNVVTVPLAVCPLGQGVWVLNSYGLESEQYACTSTAQSLSLAGIVLLALFGFCELIYALLCFFDCCGCCEDCFVY
jgi:hypothetical protein